MTAVRRFTIICAAWLLAVSSAAAQTFTSDHITVSTRGTGPDIILIHGLAGHPDVWGVAADSLDDRYRLHVVAIHGFGGVPRATSDSLIVAPVAREVARYIRETKLARPALVGHSLGGTVAMLVAADNPNLAGRVMVVDMIPFMGPMFGKPNATLEDLRPTADQMRAQLLSREMLGQMVGTMTRSEANKQMLLKFAHASDRRAVAHAMHELIMTDVRPALARITVPLTVLYVIPPGAPLPPDQLAGFMQQFYQGAKTVELVRIDDANHYIHLDQPKRFLAEVDRFMGR